MEWWFDIVVIYKVVRFPPIPDARLKSAFNLFGTSKARSAFDPGGPAFEPFCPFI